MAINTVTGKCNARDLGFTLIHEHLTAGFPGWEFDNRNFNRGFDRNRDAGRDRGRDFGNGNGNGFRAR